MRYAFFIALGLCAAVMSAKEEAISTTVLVVRIGPFSEHGMQLVSGRRFDLIECDITSPIDFRRLPADLVLVPSTANKRFAKEEGRYAKLLLRETDLKERLAARLSILIPASLPTAEKPEDLGEATPVTMKLPEEKADPNQQPQRNAGSRPSSSDSQASETPSSLGPRG